MSRPDLARQRAPTFRKASDGWRGVAAEGKARRISAAEKPKKSLLFFPLWRDKASAGHEAKNTARNGMASDKKKLQDQIERGWEDIRGEKNKMRRKSCRCWPLAGACLRPRLLPSLAWLELPPPLYTLAAVPAGHHLAPDVSMGTGDGWLLKGLDIGWRKMARETTVIYC